MSKVKKVLAMILALAMVLGTTLTAFAANNITGDSDDTADIFVHGVEQENGKTITVNAYPILVAQYENNGTGFSGYSNPYGLDVENLVDAGGNIKLTPNEVSAIAAGKMANGSDLTEGGTKCLDQAPIPLENENGIYKASVTPGMYLVVVNGSEAITYNPAVVSAFYMTEDGKNIISSGNANIVNLAAEGNVWVKRQDAPEVDKTVSDESGEAETDGKDNSVNVGDTLTYKVTINPVPRYTGKFPVLKIEDTLSEGLTFNSIESVKVYEGENLKATLSEGTDYAVILPSEKENKLTVDFAKDYNYKLNDYKDMKVVVEYSAILNSNAVVAPGVNQNSVNLTYTNNSSTASGDTTTPDEVTHTYTFDINGSATGTDGIIKKTGVDEFINALPNAEFTLYTDEACEKVYKNDSIINETTGAKFDGTSISDENGSIYFTGLAAGTYYLRETKAPTGYTVNSTIFKVEISATYLPKGGLDKYTVKITDGKSGVVSNTFSVGSEGKFVNEAGSTTTTDIKNTKISNLPSTGGIGTTIFTIGGCIIMIAAAGLFFASRRKSAKK